MSVGCLQDFQWQPQQRVVVIEDQHTLAVPHGLVNDGAYTEVASVQGMTGILDDDFVVNLS